MEQLIVAALFGYRRESEKSFAVERSIWIAAPRQRVWSAITDPLQIEMWFSPGTSWKLTALEVGGRLFVPDPETGADSGYELLPEDERWNAMEQNAFGFGMMLENLRAYIEGEDLPSPGGF
jgi:hypothetical protein